MKGCILLEPKITHTMILSSVPFMYYDPSDLGSLIPTQKVYVVVNSK